MEWRYAMRKSQAKFNIFFLVVVALQITFVVGLIALVVMGVQEINEYGLKAIVNDLWCGPKEC